MKIHFTVIPILIIPATINAVLKYLKWSLTGELVTGTIDSVNDMVNQKLLSHNCTAQLNHRVTI